MRTERAYLLVLLALLALPFLIVFGADWHRGRLADAAIKRVAPLHEAARMYLDYHEDRGVPPSKAEDLQEYAAEYPKGWEAIQDGRCVVLWNTLATDDAAVNARRVILYENRLPGRSGWVCMADGSGISMTPEEFQALRQGH